MGYQIFIYLKKINVLAESLRATNLLFALPGWFFHCGSFRLAKEANANGMPPLVASSSFILNTFSQSYAILDSLKNLSS